MNAPFFVCLHWVTCLYVPNVLNFITYLKSNEWALYFIPWRVQWTLYHFIRNGKTRKKWWSEHHVQSHINKHIEHELSELRTQWAKETEPLRMWEYESSGECLLYRAADEQQHIARINKFGETLMYKQILATYTQCDVGCLTRGSKRTHVITVLSWLIAGSTGLKFI